MMSVAQVDDVRQVNGYAAPAWTRPRSRRVQVGHLRHDALATDAADPALGVSHETSTTSRVFLLAPLSRLGHDQVTHPLQTPRPTASGSVLALPMELIPCRLHGRTYAAAMPSARRAGRGWDWKDGLVGAAALSGRIEESFLRRLQVLAEEARSLGEPTRRRATARLSRHPVALKGAKTQIP
jgi:hypothetical protein